ncbi:MAG: lipoyl(octanoyl) transferase, partial [Candidatus Omnitrophica bacterium]|nr:lipoyl(octanoyl) transferase [Candidatus Omnitrophota bacterium]
MKVIDLGQTGFLEAYEIQIDLVKKVSLGISENALLLTEH